MLDIRRTSRAGRAAFSLIEMAAAIGVMVVLLGALAGIWRGSGAVARKASCERLAGMIERARVAAVATRARVVVAVESAADGRSCRVGLFRVLEEAGDGGLDGAAVEALGRWQALEDGVVLAAGAVAGADNPLDAAPVELLVERREAPLTVHAWSFQSQGGLRDPAGSRPLGLRVVETNHRNRGGGKGASELRIGRVNGRVYQP